MKHKFLCAVLVCSVVIFATSAINAGEKYNMSTLKNDFMLLYDSEWRLFNLNYRLFAVIDKEFDTHTNAMFFGTRGFQLVFNKNNIIEKILANIFSKFQPEYESFLMSFHEKYYKLLETNPAKFSSEKIKKIPPFGIVLSFQTAAKQNLLQNVGEMIEAKLNKSISSPYIWSLWLFIGAGILIFRRFIIEKIPDSKKHSSKIKKIKMSIWSLGMLAMIFGIFQVSRGLFFTQGLMRDFINEQSRLLYTSEIPNEYWANLEPYIKSAVNDD